MNEYSESKRLDEVTCQQLLAAHRFGRIAVAHDERIDVVAVEYTFERGVLLLRAATTQSLPVGAHALFEVDQAPGEAQGGWSLTVAGRLEQADENDAEAVPNNHANDHPLLRLPIERLEGYRIAPANGHDPAADPTWSGRDASDLIG
jgi:nitroimidazol reductase NimA-like FMN-containing flavoprotein (pyridoxamine 5'-phosphate oxidase superfamily)